jgi:hypothetical protein
MKFSNMVECGWMKKEKRRKKIEKNFFSSKRRSGKNDVENLLGKKKEFKDKRKKFSNDVMGS